MVLKEFDQNADRWYKQVVLKDIKGEKTLNQEIKKLITAISPPVSQQKRLERKISKKIYFSYVFRFHCTIIFNLYFKFPLKKRKMN